MKTVPVEKLVSLCDEMADLKTLRAWAQAQVDEENAKALIAGEMITAQITCQKRNEETKELEPYKKPVLAKPLGSFFALHNHGPEDYQGKGHKTLTHLPSGLSVAGKFRKPLRDVVAFVQALEALDIDWSLEKPINGLNAETSRAVAEIVREFNE